jgi:DNA-binding HxlR family transcriptional regulator
LSQPAKWRHHVPQPGDIAFALLEPKWSATLVITLADRPQRPAELKQQLSDAPHSTLVERLGDLARGTVVVRQSLAGDLRGASYALSESGRELAEIVTAATSIERERSNGSGLHAAGEQTLRLIANPSNREIGRLLINGPLALVEIERGLPRRPRSSINRHLRNLLRAGTIEAWHGQSGRTRYELAMRARRLAFLVLLAARWDRRWRPHLRVPSDVGGVIQMVAPLAHVAPGHSGICRLHIESEPAEADVHMTISKGQISTFPLPPTTSYDAYGTTTPESWGRALLRRELVGIEIDGDCELLTAAVVALSESLRT